MAQNSEYQLRTLQAYEALTRWGSRILLGLAAADTAATAYAEMVQHRHIAPVLDATSLASLLVGAGVCYIKSKEAQRAIYAAIPPQVQAEQQPAPEVQANPLPDPNPPARGLLEMLEEYPGTYHPQEQQPQE